MIRPPIVLPPWFAPVRGRRVAVVGDLLADEFIYGRVERVSREAPVLILRYDHTIVVPGGAGNAAANVAALGGEVGLAALVGRDDVGRRLLKSFPARVSRAAIVRPAGYHTPVKTRILAGGIHSAKQQVVRIDRIRSAGPTDRTRIQFSAAARRAVAAADAVIVSDYGSGLVTARAGRPAAPARAGKASRSCSTRATTR